MSWIDDQDYFGPDRRTRSTLRLTNRRQRNLAGVAPHLGTALRQLRMRVIDAFGDDGIQSFVERAQGVSALARQCYRPQIADLLDKMCEQLTRTGTRDMRPDIEAFIDKLQVKVA